MSNIDDIRAELYKGEGQFVEQLKTSDKAPEELRTELLVRLNLNARTSVGASTEQGRRPP